MPSFVMPVRLNQGFVLHVWPLALPLRYLVELVCVYVYVYVSVCVRACVRGVCISPHSGVCISPRPRPRPRAHHSER